MLRAAAIQFFATPFDLTRNLETAGRLARAAAEQGAQIIVLPELFNTGYVYTPRLLAFAETENGLTLRHLRRWSAELNVYLAGPLLLREDEHIFNVFALVGPDGKVHKYRKQNPFLWERCYFEAGREPLVIETGLGRIGLMTCWDIARRDISEAYRGKVDALLIASAPPRFHRAVLNFPLGKKVYLAQLMPALLRDRDVMDDWYLNEVAALADWLDVPIVHAVMAGRFVTEVPFPRLSFLAAAITRPRPRSRARACGRSPRARTSPPCAPRSTGRARSSAREARRWRASRARRASRWQTFHSTTRATLHSRPRNSPAISSRKCQCSCR
ncbi:MAG: ramA 1 [Anaerolineales bacterium]|nr:ramA 1 [Anaerolineales bacterium]